MESKTFYIINEIKTKTKSFRNNEMSEKQKVKNENWK